MLDFDSEYALLRATSDRAWEIEKRLGMNSAALVVEDEGLNDWRSSEISRIVATRIASVATWMKDPKERAKRLQAAENIRLQAMTSEKQQTLLSSRMQALAKPKGNPVQVLRESPPKRPTRLSMEKAPSTSKTIPVRKTWTKASATPPVEIDLPWETSDDNPPPKHDAQEKPKNPPKQSNLTEKKKLQESKRVTNIKRSPTKTMTISPEKHSIASAQEGMPETPSKVIPAASIEEMNPKAIKQMSTIPIENHAKVTFEMPSTPQGSDKEVPSTAQPLRHEVLVPSSIGPQFLSSFRSMPSATFGYSDDMTPWSIPFMRRLFHDLDVDRDGLITKLELSVALHRLQVYVPPARITKFFNQAASLNHSQLQLITFGQFLAFMTAAKENEYKPPPPPSKVQVDSMPPPHRQPSLAVDDDEVFHLDKILPDLITNRVMERLQAKERTANVSAEDIRQIARELILQHVTAENKNDDGSGLKGMEAQLAAPTTSPPVSSVSAEDEIYTLVKARLLEQVVNQSSFVREESDVAEVSEQHEVEPKSSEILDKAEPGPASNPALVIPQERPESTPPTMPRETPTMAEQATDTMDLNHDEQLMTTPIIRNLAELPGKTLLGKALHCENLGDLNIREHLQPPTKLLTTLKRMRAQRIKTTSYPRSPSPPPAPPLSPRQSSYSPPFQTSSQNTVAEFNEPPPPAPPLSPKESQVISPRWTTGTTQVPQDTPKMPSSAPSTQPLTELYVMRPPPSPPTPFVPVVSQSMSSFDSHSISDPPDDDLLSEGEVLNPDSFSDGEIEGPSRHLFYHLHRVQFQQKRINHSAASSIEDGELSNSC
ncbi:hypothetical protein AeMF1_001857 [Aphanomyces euteiches]|nr:hypothetical protein AeMF1_001857 [Aphanomyces euteiches]KAH9189680.1 hypothetical protein AeNC1_008351 [Aphanomyces euteiches]